jgi:NADH-quinone oxidoreductase subunit C
MEEQKVSKAEQLAAAVTSVCGSAVLRSVIERGDVTIHVAASQILEVLTRCKQSPELDFSMLIDITAVDWLDERPERFQVVYQLLSLAKCHRITVVVALAETSARIDSATALWNGANFLEREVWDMFGITFVGHPDLRRILMYDEFVGHPLRKDYPVQGKQPRIELRSPEVENTARRMHRTDLVTIKSRSSREREQRQESSGT